MTLLAKIGLGVLAAPLIVYGLDELWLDIRHEPTQTIKVDHYYKDENRWGSYEYSIGSPVQQVCVLAMFPHHGYPPCWYVQRHTLAEVDTT